MSSLPCGAGEEEESGGKTLLRGDRHLQQLRPGGAPVPTYQPSDRLHETGPVTLQNSNSDDEQLVVRENVLGSLHTTQHLLSTVNLLHHTDWNVEKLNINN